MSTISTNLHVHGDSQIKGSAYVTEHEYSNGPYPVVNLKVAGFDLSIFPGARADELADALLEAGEQLRKAIATIQAASLRE